MDTSALKLKVTPGSIRLLLGTMLWRPTLAEAQAQKFATHFPLDAANVPAAVRAVTEVARTLPENIQLIIHC
jgi:hypothetical protein